MSPVRDSPTLAAVKSPFIIALLVAIAPILFAAEKPNIIDIMSDDMGYFD